MEIYEGKIKNDAQQIDSQDNLDLKCNKEHSDDRKKKEEI